MASADDLSELSAWFENQVVENYRLFFSIAYQILGDSHAAEETTQDAVLKAWSCIGELQDPAKVAGWIARIARNAALDRRKRRVPDTMEDTALDAIRPSEYRESDADRNDERVVLLREIGNLPEGQADVVTLRFFEGLDIRQIAGRLGLMENAVRVRLHRGLENLRKRPRLRAMSEVDA